MWERIPWSNMHNLNLDWIIKVVLELQKAWQELDEDNAQFKEYVTTYLANLDIDEEIAGNIQKMVEDGSFQQLLVSPVSEWLRTHIMNPSNPPLDNSLSLEGAAAESYYVGEALKIALQLRYDVSSVIPNGTDFNNLTIPGNYRVSSIANMQTMINSPVSVAAKIVVLSTTSNNTLYQFVLPNSSAGAIYYRHGSSQNWNEWVKLSDTSTLQSQINTLSNSQNSLQDKVDTAVNLKSIFSTRLDANTDFNDLQTPGSYHTDSNAHAASMANIPVNFSGRLFVMGNVPDTSVYQFYFPNRSAPGFFFRYRSSVIEWIPWQRVKDVQELETSLNSAKAQINDSFTLRYTYGAVLSDNTDFNTLLTPGNFRISTNASMATMINSPVSVGARLTVLTTSSDGSVYQILFPNQSRPGIYFRFYSTSIGWIEWQRVRDSEELYSTISAMQNEVNSAFNLDFNHAEVLTNGTDFNTLTSPGNYRVTSSSSMQTMINSPVAVGARIQVMAIYSAGTIQQFLFPYDTAGVIWVRLASGGGWTNWERIGNSASTVRQVVHAANHDATFGDFNNAPVNTVYQVTTTEGMDNRPPGSNVVDRNGEDSGFLNGTLITYKSGRQSNIDLRAQLFICNAASSKTFACYRSSYISSGALVWTDWVKMGQDMFLRATNVAIRKEMVDGLTAPFYDCNDAPLNSIYQLDLDLAEGVMPNNPFPGHSSILITTGFSFTVRHGQFQMCVALWNGVQVAVRYGYQNAPNDYRFTPWRKLLTEEM